MKRSAMVRKSGLVFMRVWGGDVCSGSCGLITKTARCVERQLLALVGAVSELFELGMVGLVAGGGFGGEDQQNIFVEFEEDEGLRFVFARSAGGELRGASEDGLLDLLPPFLGAEDVGCAERDDDA